MLRPKDQAPWLAGCEPVQRALVLGFGMPGFYLNSSPDQSLGQESFVSRLLVPSGEPKL